MRRSSIYLLAGSLLLTSCAAPAVDEEPESDAPAKTSKKSRSKDAGTEGSSARSNEPRAPRAAGLSIREVAFYQVLKIDLVAQGKSVTPQLPIVAGREGVLRVFVEPNKDWKPRPVTARLTLTTKGKEKTFDDVLTPMAASTDEELDSTFRFEVAAEDLDPTTTWRLQLLDLAKGAKDGGAAAQWPREDDEQAPFGARAIGNLKVRVVPIRMSNKLLSDIGAPTLSDYRQYIRKLYPVPDIEVSIMPVWDYSGTVPRTDGAGWSELLTNLANKHRNDKAPPDVYYIGVFRPAQSFSAYCPLRTKCGAIGLGYLLEDASLTRAPEFKSAIMLGFSSSDAAILKDALPHEVGHNHGRQHAPCENKAESIDPNYPDKSGGIRVWGYDFVTKTFLNPQSSKPPRDMMSYCIPVWVSDYTYDHLYKRGVALSQWMNTMSAAPRARYRQLLVQGDGSLEPGEVVERSVLRDLSEEVELVDEMAELEVGRGLFIPFDHLPGGTLLVPERAGKTYTGGRLVRSLSDRGTMSDP